MVKLIGKILRNGIIYSLKVSPHRILINYRGEQSNFTMENSDRHYHNLAEDTIYRSPV